MPPGTSLGRTWVMATTTGNPWQGASWGDSSWIAFNLYTAPFSGTYGSGQDIAMHVNFRTFGSTTASSRVIYNTLTGGVWGTQAEAAGLCSLATLAGFCGGSVASTARFRLTSSSLQLFLSDGTLITSFPMSGSAVPANAGVYLALGDGSGTQSFATLTETTTWCPSPPPPPSPSPPPAGIMELPPTAMSGSSASASGTGADGTYVVTASSVYGGSSFPANQAFDKSRLSYWISGAGTYASNAAYAGSVSLLVSGTSRSGEWLRLQLPRAYTLTSYVMQSSDYRTELARSWVLAGSNDLSTFTQVRACLACFCVNWLISNLATNARRCDDSSPKTLSTLARSLSAGPCPNGILTFSCRRPAD